MRALLYRQHPEMPNFPFACFGRASLGMFFQGGSVLLCRTELVFIICHHISQGPANERQREKPHPGKIHIMKHDWANVYCHQFPSSTPVSSLTQHISWQHCIKCYFFKLCGKGTCHFHFLHRCNICFIITSNKRRDFYFILLNSWADYPGFPPASGLSGSTRAEAGAAVPLLTHMALTPSALSQLLQTWQRIIFLLVWSSLPTSSQEGER